jgi:branched-chain amino acid transport system permease protein
MAVLIQLDRATRIQLLLGTAAVLVSVLAPALLGSAYWTHNFLIVNLFVAVAVLQNMLLADAGQVSFGQGAVFGLSAFTVGIVSGLWGQSFVVGLVAGVLMAVVLGLVFALPALRVQGYYLGFVTLSAAVVFPEMLVAFDALTNGINGITRAVPELTVPIRLGPIGLGLSWIAVLVMAVAIGALVFHAMLRGTRLGRQMRVSAVSPEAAMALGLNPGALRFVAFTIAAAGTGLAGALYVPVLGFVSPYAFRVDLSIFFFFSVVIGGNGQLLGPVIGAWILYLVPNALLADLANYRLLGYGIVALLIMLGFPDGVVGSIEKMRRRHRLRTHIAPIGIDPVLTSTGTWPRAASGIAISVTGARKEFGSLAALGGVDLAIAAGTVHGLVGPNGSGKTTLLNAVSGFIALNGGRITIRGTETTRLPAWRIARLGVGRTFQTPRVFDEMSIWENLEIGADVRRGESWLLALLAPFRAQWAEARPDVLPHAQRRVLEVLRTVASDADILLLDEPAAGLSAAERREFARLVRFLAEKLGKTVLLVEHDLALVWKVADRITVLDAGVVVAEGPPDAIAADMRVRALFTGSPVDA